MDTAQIEKLIKLVSCYPQLYDSNNIDHADQHKRDLIWDVIGNELNLAPDFCRAKWTILRSGYRKALRNSQSDVINIRKKWRFEDSMSFLRDCIQNRKSQRCFELKRKNSTTTNNVSDEDEDTVDIKEEPEELTYEESNEYIQEDDRMSSCDSMAIADVLKMTTVKYPPTTDKERKENRDAVTQFFLSMAETVKILPPLMQAQIKAEVFSCVSAAEIKYLQKKK
ncbi:MADF DNA bdg domain containing protein [Asbolus verrucosus]|uniref:MADF DNA bdg domain containing protein n=1 Tax=Asbolus verrucosus TaxID=1661398 RepID=A0A482VD92_ASBVE|nr:MADF DNA bdg domain containing protein [Asbolus verrucosus]